MRLAPLLVLIGLTGVCASPPVTTGPLPQGAARPGLVVFVAIDQLHPDYLSRFRSQLSGGFDRLLKGGAVFTRGFHDHAITETAPGHASMMSGRFPRGTGITRNLLGVNGPDYPLLGSGDVGASPFRFKGTTLTDWLTAVDPRTRAFSVSQKDRGAILPIGRSRQQVYWYASNGTFTTSTWYADSLPDWVRQFNARRIPFKAAATRWELLRPESDYAERDSVPYENFGRRSQFPYQLPADSAAAARVYVVFPMMDELVAAFALEGVSRLQLGARGATDILAVSFSATDQIGHRFGPESREIHDQILRLDRTLGRFIDSLYRLRDSSRIVIALTADHGVAPIPELHGKLRVSLSHALDSARAAVRAVGGDTTQVELESGAFFVGDSGRVAGTEAFMRVAKATPGVLRVDRYDDLKRANLEKDTIGRRWVHMFSPEMQPTAVATLAPGHMPDWPLVATHGSPHDYDAHVPIVFYGPAFKPGRYSETVRVVDMGPTLARVLGVEPTEPVDGRPLVAALR
jgi:predicted AlkP superfamily pyrophosphatase or phosphodiesterase